MAGAIKGQEDVDLDDDFGVEITSSDKPDKLDELDDSADDIFASDVIDKEGPFTILDEEPEDKKESKDPDDELDAMVLDDLDEPSDDPVGELVDTSKDDKFSKRLGREQRLKQDARKDVERMSAHTSELTVRVRDAEVARLRDHRDSANITLDNLQSNEELLNGQLKMARELENEDAIIQIQDSLVKTKSSIMQVQQIVDNSYTDDQLNDYQPDIQRPNVRQQLGSKAQDWMDNNAWMNDPKYGVQQAAVRAIDKELAQSGMDPQTDEYFKQLTWRVHKTVSGIEATTNTGHRFKTPEARTRGGSGKTSRNSSARQERTSAAGRAATTRNVITKNDVIMMESLGMNAMDRETQKQWLANKVK